MQHFLVTRSVISFAWIYKNEPYKDRVESETNDIDEKDTSVIRFLAETPASEVGKS